MGVFAARPFRIHATDVSMGEGAKKKWVPPGMLGSGNLELGGGRIKKKKRPTFSHMGALVARSSDGLWGLCGLCGLWGLWGI